MGSYAGDARPGRQGQDIMQDTMRSTSLEKTESTDAAGTVSPAAARLISVSKLFGSFAALRKVSVDFPVGSSTMVLGDNGAGKSTLLRLLAGLIAPTRGTVQVFSEEPRDAR